MKKRKINKAKKICSGYKNNGTCSACKSSRLHQANRELERSLSYVEEINVLKNSGANE